MGEQQQTWYLARDGAIVLQGSRADLARAARGGFLRGDEACWTEGMAAWEPVGESPKAAWIREASKVHEEMTGTLLQFSAPEGTDELEIPREPAWAQPDAPVEAPKQTERRRSHRGRRATDKPPRRGGGLLIGLICGASLALGIVVFLALPVPEAPSPEPLPTAPSSSPDAQPVQDVSRPSETDAGPAPQEKPPLKGKATVPVQPPKRKKIAAPPSQDLPAPAVKAAPPVTDRIVTVTKDKDTATVQAALDKVKQNDKSPVRSANREAELRRSLATRQAKFLSCLKSAKIAKPGLRGNVTFVISVSTSGQVTGVRSASGRPGPEYAAACLLGELESLKFPTGAATQVRIKAAVP